MVKSWKKVSNPPKDVSPSSTKIANNQFEKAPWFNGNFNIWEARMRNFLKTQGSEIWKSMIVDSMMDGESKEYNEKAMKVVLNGLPDSIKNNLGERSSAKGIWDKFHDLHSKGELTMTISQEDDGTQEEYPKPIIEVESKNDDIKAKEYLEDEENEKDFVEDLLTQLMDAMEEILNLKKENEELKKKSLAIDQDQTRKKVDLVKLQVQERDEDLAKLKKEFHQSKRKQHEEVISMTNHLDKEKKREDTLSSQLEKGTRA